MKHSKTDLSNVVRELSNYMDEANTSHYKALLHAINDIIDTKYYLYQIKLYGNLNGPWQIRGYSYADYARYNNSRKSVTGYIIIINGVVINWSSLGHKKFTLYITESEYSEIPELCCEILFSHANGFVYGGYFQIPQYHTH